MKIRAWLGPVIAFLVGAFVCLCVAAWAVTYFYGGDPVPAALGWVVLLAPLLGGIGAVLLVKYGPGLLQKRSTRLIGIALGGGAGALLAGCLVFLVGIFLPILISTSNLGPLAGIVLVPEGMVWGGIGAVFVAFLRPSALKSSLIGASSALLGVVLLFARTDTGAPLHSDEVMAISISGVVILGFVGYAVWAVLVRAKSNSPTTR